VVRVPSYAKVNLGLEVLRVHEDGYHELRTLFQSVTLADTLELTLTRRPEIGVSCAHPLVPRDPATNLAARAARDLQRFAGVPSGVLIRIDKRIPVGGGLGGGSSNAAAVLLALDRAWGLGLGPTGLLPLARRLGADVPYFLHGGTALGVSRGDEVYPLLRQLRGHLVLVAPEVSVSTAAVFRRVDARLTPREKSHSIYAFVSSDLEGRAAFSALTNELEEAALEEAPVLRDQVRDIRRTLVREGALLAALSGSGSTYFGLFASGAGAAHARAVLAARGFRALRARTLSFEAYKRSFRRALATSEPNPRGRGR
jgi:4-diphosphocytidyl-2-C-methyl-D-erythritol kinase